MTTTQRRSRRIFLGAILLLACGLPPLTCLAEPAEGGRSGFAAVFPPNTWTRVEIDWAEVLAREVEDGRWVTTDGYSDNVLRTRTGEVLIRTGIESKTLGTSPGFYTNTTVAWKLATDEARVVEISNFGGGSYGHGRLLPAFAEHETPTPRHTYDGICYVPEEDAMYQMLGANWRVGGRIALRKGAAEDAKRQLEIDNRSTWRYGFTSGRWKRIDHNVWKFFKTSPYESHLAHWPEGGKLLFLDDGGSHYAEFDLKTQRWQKQQLAGQCPMRLYNARSTWDSRRGLWVFRLGPRLCTFDPKTRTFAKLPDCWQLQPATSPEKKKQEPRWASKGICYISRHDAYLVTGPTGNDTRVYDVATGRWTDLQGGDIELVNGYCQYEPQSDLVVMSYQLQCYRLRYMPGR